MPLPMTAPPSGAPAGVAARVQRRMAALVGRPAFWALVLTIGLAVPILNQVTQPRVPPLPVLGTLPAFHLTAADGRPFGSKELKGTVWVAGFIFVRCPTICPAISATMAKMQHRARGLGPAFKLVSFSVDPTHDTPEKLAEYARRWKASPRRWHFLTGPLDEMRGTVTDGLKIAMGDPPGEQDFASLFHGTHFVLVDHELRIRGYYDSSDPDVVNRVLHDGAMLINRGE